jgi:hypothetical protein
MRIGFLVDGQAEYQGLRQLTARLSPHPIVRVLYCDIQPLATPGQMAHAAAKRFPILAAAEVDTVVLLVDKETRSECSGELADAIRREAEARLKTLALPMALHVVLKVTKLENWLVADPQALRELPGVFEDVDRIERQVAKGRADAVDALQLLRGCARKRVYVKTDGAVAICRKLDPARAAANSRSLRKLLKVVGHPAGLEPPKPRRRG